MAQQQQEFNMKKALPIFIVIGAILLLIIFWSSMTVTMKPGERAVVFRTFVGGIDVDKEPLGEGFHFIAPWNKAIVYNIQKKELTEMMNGISSDGLEIQLDLTLIYNVQEATMARLHKEIGVDYVNKIIKPTIRSATRKIIGRYTPEELYSTKRNEIQSELTKEIELTLKDKYINLDEVLIRQVVLPAKIKSAIEDKLEQEQIFKAYEFRLKREEKEAERKKIAAQGEADYNQIVNESLSDKLLIMRGIDATIELSKSNNTKVVVVGSGDDGLPLILGNN